MLLSYGASFLLTAAILYICVWLRIAIIIIINDNNVYSWGLFWAKLNNNSKEEETVAESKTIVICKCTSHMNLFKKKVSI